jgi:hypothetical protein
MGSTARVRGPNQNERLRVLRACKASTQRTRRVSVASVFIRFSPTGDTETEQSARHNNVA